MENMFILRHRLEEMARSIRLRQKNQTFLHEMAEVLTRIYGSDRYEIRNLNVDSAIKEALAILGYESERVNGLTVELFDRLMALAIAALNYKVVIYYPEIIISNSDGDEHKITDLYVSMSFDEHGHLTGSISGLRTSFTHMEINAQYIHSHLPRYTGDFKFRGFCTGTGVIVRTLASLTNNFVKEDFELFCYQINSLLEWESLEGTPFVQISDIERVLPLVLSPPLPVANTSPIVRSFLQSVLTKVDLIKDVLSLAIENEKIVVEKNSQLEDFITSSILEHYSMDNPLHLLSVKNSQGQYFRVPSDNIIAEAYTQVLPATPIIKFKGIEKFIKISNDENQRIKQYPNPAITRAVCEKLSAMLTEYHLRRACADAQTPYPGDREGAVPNLVSLQASA